jgi:hypothetical protein
MKLIYFKLSKPQYSEKCELCGQVQIVPAAYPGDTVFISYPRGRLSSRTDFRDFPHWFQKLSQLKHQSRPEIILCAFLDFMAIMILVQFSSQARPKRRENYGQKAVRKSDEQLLSDPGNLATTVIVSKTILIQLHQTLGGGGSRKRGFSLEAANPFAEP